MIQPQSTRIRADAGFTLLELVATLALLALAFGLVMPRLSGSRQSLSLRATAAELAAELENTRSLAATRNADAVFVVDTVARTYSGTKSSRTIPSDVGLSFQTSEAVLSSTSRGVFRFRSDRTASGGNIVLSSGRDIATISIDWLTGAVSVRWGA